LGGGKGREPTSFEYKKKGSPKRQQKKVVQDEGRRKTRGGRGSPLTGRIITNTDYIHRGKASKKGRSGISTQRVLLKNDEKIRASNKV